MMNATPINDISPWNNLSAHHLPQLPHLYLLEKTHVTFQRDLIQKITAVITEHLQNSSISIEGHHTTNENNNTTALAHTLDNVQFFIRFFRDCNNNNDTSKEIILEIQKKCGCSMSFHKASSSILRAVRDLIDPTSKKRKREGTTPMLMSYPRRGKLLRPTLLNRSEKIIKPSNIIIGRPKSLLLSQSQTDNNNNNNNNDNNNNNNSSFASTLEMTDNLLKKDRIDANMLGMESLKLLTDHKSTSQPLAFFVSKRVVCGGDQFDDLKLNIMKLIVQSSSVKEEEEEMNMMERQHRDTMHNLALTVLANALSVLSSTPNDNDAEPLGSFLSSTSIEEEWTELGLLPALLQELQVGSSDNAKIRPHDAYQACRCLKHIIGSSNVWRRRVIELGGGPDVVVRSSSSLGWCCSSHVLLEEELGKVVRAFGKVN